MQSPSRFLFWWRWLVVVTLGVLLFGITLIVAPEFTRRFFGLLLFSAPETLATFGSPAVAYLTLLHGVLGAVMVGWAVALLFVPLLAWFVPYTALSLWSGFWPNAALNLVFAVLFAVPLVATSGAFNEKLA
jgi:uncharacterized membrane protein YhaH (DUF805 family)